jgi:ABC-2 type transport system permease protein
MIALPQAFIFMAMVAITFAALGTAFGSVIKDMQGFPIVMNFMVMPMFFLSGALYPLSHLPSVLTVITRLDPLTYGIDGLRGSLTGAWHFNFALDVAVMGFIAAAFLSLGAYFFSKIQI